MKILLAQEPLSDSSRLDQNCATRTMRSLLVLLCLTLASTGPDSAPGSPLDLGPPSESPVALEAGTRALLRTKSQTWKQRSRLSWKKNQVRMVRPLKSAKAPTTWSWKSEEVPGVLEEQIAEEECRKSAALDKKREKKEKKKDKKHAKDKKKKKEKKDKKTQRMRERNPWLCQLA